MPIQIIWGNDIDACTKEIEKIIKINVSKNWVNLNVGKFNGEDPEQVNNALDAMLTPPLGEGSRIVLLKNSPIMNMKNDSLTKKFEINSINIPNSTYLILQNVQKPDSRIKTVKYLKELIKQGKAKETSFNLPSIWDQRSQIEYIKNIAKNMNINLSDSVSEKILDAIGIDSGRLENELEKAKLYITAQKTISSADIQISEKDIEKIFDEHQSNIFKITDLLLEEKITDSLIEINYLINQGEVPLKMTIGLINQIRVHTIVLLLFHEKDLNKICSLANISNPKRIFFIRKKVKNCSPKFLINLMIQFLNIESSIKKGNNSMSVFTENLITLTQKSSTR